MSRDVIIFAEEEIINVIVSASEPDPVVPESVLIANDYQLRVEADGGAIDDFNCLVSQINDLL